jgi:Uma2 family endonuclease
VLDAPPKRKSKKIPLALIREELRGKPLYYKGYKEVINGSKQIEEIMGSSSTQAILVFIIGYFVKSKINKKQFLIATNEAGLHIGHKNNLSADIAIFFKEQVTLNDKYFDVAPVVAIEIDIKIDTDKEIDYVFSKSEEMMAFGTQTVCWILTKSKKIFLFAKGQNTQIFEWTQTVQLMETLDLNLQDLLNDEEIIL